MLCPEVWNLPYTKNNISIEKGQLSKKSEQFLEKLINKHPFNETLSIAIAEEESISEEIGTIINSSFYYIVKDFKLTDLIRKDFIEAFIKRGNLTALNTIEFNEVDDIFAVTPDGILILSINKDLYQSIGLDGRPHKSFSRKKDRFIIEIDLKTIQFDKKPYQRLNFALSNELFNDFNIQMKIIWEPPQQSICRSSLAKYFHDLGKDVEYIQPIAKVHKFCNLEFPKFSIEKFDKNDLNVYEFIEYLNITTMSCNDVNIHELLNTSTNLNDIEPISNLKIINCKGYFESGLILKLLNEIRKLLNFKDNIKWIALNVNGYRESPISFYNNDHSFSFNGDNDFLLIFYKNGNYLLQKNICSSKVKK